MEKTIFTPDNIKIVLSIIGVIVTVIMSQLSIKRLREERNLKLLDRLSIVMDKVNVNNKFEVSILFENLTGLKLTYREIKSILNQNDSLWIINTLKLFPGIVKYEGNKLNYNGLFINNKFRSTFHFIEGFYLFFFGFILLSSIYLFITTTNFWLLVPIILFTILSDKLIKNRNLIKEIKKQIKPPTVD